MPVDLSKSQDVAKCLDLLASSVHPTAILDAFAHAAVRPGQILAAVITGPVRLETWCTACCCKREPEQQDVWNVLDLRDIKVVVKRHRTAVEERKAILQMVKVRASGCNVLLIQKYTLKDAATQLPLQCLILDAIVYTCGPGDAITAAVTDLFSTLHGSAHQ
ncbi:hypothetical protein WJX73_002575 [Symbiochloris irregularis]|uniref:Uncharacterized protein n=1 Tax=Symbiochloris irregularis TaxID=706552 RepID=A0AAW1PJG5_9CHLO